MMTTTKENESKPGALTNDVKEAILPSGLRDLAKAQEAVETKEGAAFKAQALSWDKAKPVRDELEQLQRRRNEIAEGILPKSQMLLSTKREGYTVHHDPSIVNVAVLRALDSLSEATQQYARRGLRSYLTERDWMKDKTPWDEAWDRTKHAANSLSAPGNQGTITEYAWQLGFLHNIDPAYNLILDLWDADFSSGNWNSALIEFDPPRKYGKSQFPRELLFDAISRSLAFIEQAMWNGTVREYLRRFRGLPDNKTTTGKDIERCWDEARGQRLISAAGADRPTVHRFIEFIASEGLSTHPSKEGLSNCLNDLLGGAAELRGATEHLRELIEKTPEKKWEFRERVLSAPAPVGQTPNETEQLRHDQTVNETEQNAHDEPEASPTDVAAKGEQRRRRNIPAMLRNTALAICDLAERNRPLMDCLTRLVQPSLPLDSKESSIKELRQYCGYSDDFWNDGNLEWRDWGHFRKTVLESARNEEYLQYFIDRITETLSTPNA